jgi:hypothetical protein
MRLSSVTRAMRERLALVLAPLLAVLCASAAAPTWVSYRSAYVDALLDRPGDADSVELLVTAEEFELAGRKDEARDLRDFVERRIWLAALREPPAPATTVRDAVTAKWPEHIWSLRRRGTHQLLAMEPLAAWLDGEAAPSFEGPADDGYTSNSTAARTLNARFRVTNAGARPVAAFEIQLDVPFDTNGLQRFACRWHDHEPLRSAESRDIACRWLVAEREALLARDGLSAAPGSAARLVPALANVSFLEAERRVPYALDNNFSVGGDLDLARRADERTRAASCSRRGACELEVDLLGLSLDALPWLVLPALLGALLGGFARRRKAQ